MMGQSEMWDAQIDVMAKAGQALAIQWGHEPWSDSWARLVARAMLDAQRCPVCGEHFAGDHYECVVGEPREPSTAETCLTDRDLNPGAYGGCFD